MVPTMSVLTIVHRALPPLSLPWRRRTSLKGKAPELQIQEILNEKNHPLSPGPGPEANWNQSVMHRDVVQIAVKSDAPEHNDTPQSATSITDNTIPADSDSSSECQAESSNQARRSRARIVRAVGWASIVRSGARWTEEQEVELVRAQRQLGRCQKAWSSEQEVWLSYVQALSEEKEAHEGFLSMRHRQQDEEQYQFRKAWKRRRSSSTDDEAQQSAVETGNRLGRLRPRLPRYGSGQRLGVTGSTAVAVEG
ncbi:uncharacterized protein N7515_004515 [Penicillium bovifimosum]|uniref:Uncharacterized protein n=1 Tax=Penicillium bovifimosum TaxID=126998 RepID=A0A9W9H087_9EURO|nr:uncharacterized protein N7515_004515 [Penicillium bovifimosum]KAJ5135237.1 hypothetical protein N7515_004515 [Penicillium bovifimosum]